MNNDEQKTETEKERIKPHMKEVVNNNNIPLVNISDVNYEKYYGIQHKYGNKAFIVREYGNQVRFAVYYSDLLIRKPEPKNSAILFWVIEELLSDGYRVFEFNSSRALFAWLGK